MSCPFCELEPGRLVWSGPLTVAIRDGFPVSPGHTLIMPRRHVGTWFEATPAEKLEILEAIESIKLELDQRTPRPNGYNIGINVGTAAGQTVMHLHVHLVPRFEGDVDDPAGGVRFVIPAFGNYRQPGKLPRPRGAEPSWLSSMGSPQRLATGGDDPFGLHLRPALRRARCVHIVAAFVQGSGVDLLDSAITEALTRGADFRVITGDYLQITQVRALRTLLDWSRASASSEDPDHGRFSVRVVETSTLGGRSFHPKSWRVETEHDGIAWVGSSNWSRMALRGGIEWNLRVDRASDPKAYGEVADAFESLWDRARPLTEGWLQNYAERARTSPHPLPPGESEDIVQDGPFEPIGVQPAALDALHRAREQGRTRALVVLATGLGKTFLSAFDVQALAETLGRQPRLLFIAHRRELLIQAAKTYRRVFPDASIGFFVGPADEMDCDLVFASVQKLSLEAHLSTLDPDDFDYVVVDESHHAPAASYRRVLRRLDPRFLLGLTATPERADQADVAGLFDDHIAFEANLGEGIALGRLSPFDYAGLPDTIEFEAIPWRRYTLDQLSHLAETEARMERLLEAWQAYPGTRTLVFCVSINHADFVRTWLAERGIRIVACHTGPNSDDRDTSLEQLSSGALDAVAAVDLFNEGIDLPMVDRVIMLRPTASPVIFMQQLGRGLRVAEGKERLQVIDFIGNHRAFLNKVRTLLSLDPSAPSLGSFLRSGDPDLELSDGCRVNVDLQVIEMLEKFLPSGASNETIRLYRELRDTREERPSAGELVRMGMNPRTVKAESWFAFVHEEGDLSEAQSAAFERSRRWFRHLEVSAMTKSFKMVTLEVLLAEEALFDGIALSRLAERCHDALRRDPSLRSDIATVDAFHAGPDASAWAAYWKKNPIKAWSNGKWFKVVDGQLHFTLDVSEGPVREAFVELTRELADMRLATYRRRNQGEQDGVSTFQCKVIHNQRSPILKLPDVGRERLPEGETDVRLDDGRVWQFRFMKIACNVARPVGSRDNALPDLLFRWFGPSAGKPGTDFHVRFRRSPDGWWAEPLGAVIELPDLGNIITFPTLRAAAGAAGESQALVEADSVRLPFGGAGRFAVRAAGHSMDGGRSPIRDGDWVVLEWARGQGPGAVAGKVCLVAKGDPDEGPSYHLKRLVRADRGFRLRSDNPASPDLAVDGDTTVIARRVETVRPEQLGPARGTVVQSVQQTFGLTTEPSPGVSRVDGHLFLLLHDKGDLTRPDQATIRVADRGPSETAFIFTVLDPSWRYAGVGRWNGQAWVFPEVDHPTWKALGKGRGASRELEEAWADQARSLTTFLGQELDHGESIEARGRSCRYQGPSARGGVRIDRESMKERTVSVTDLAWVLQAYERRADNGGRLDEAWVNRLRYLEGTPKSSTRWIDTGWAMVLVEWAVGRGFEAKP